LIGKFTPPPHGSGNTWARLLIEYSTGYFTGSIDVNDFELRQLFTGEAACGLRTSIVKGHPSDMILKEEKSRATGRQVVNIRFIYKVHRKKCQRGSIHFWEKVVLLVRDPYNAIFAEFQRRHTGSANISYFNASAHNHTIWLENALKSAEDYEVGMEHLVYPIVLGSQSAGLLVGSIELVRNISNFYPRESHSNDSFRKLPEVGVAILRFENLLNTSRRVNELQKILTFMNYSVPSERIDCAFLLAEQSTVHRSKKINITIAYNHVRPSLPFDMWNHLETFSSIFSYPNWGRK
jgi:hypothetical protein